MISIAAEYAKVPAALAFTDEDGKQMKELYVEGFKSLCTRQRVALSGITVFAGSNSSGKSSSIQPLLLLKQTIESQYDPGALLLDGPNTKFTSLDQILSGGSSLARRSSFTVEITSDAGVSLSATYGRRQKHGIEIKSAALKGNGVDVVFREGKRFSEVEGSQLQGFANFPDPYYRDFQKSLGATLNWEALSARCFPDVRMIASIVRGDGSKANMELDRIKVQEDLRKDISSIIHIQGLRGNPERTYSSTAKISQNFPGLFTSYVASILQRWQEQKDHRIDEIGADLRALGLSWKVKTRLIQDTQVEIRVSRLTTATQGGANDLVNLADVGLGVSQILPFLVALRAARKGQVVFIEQPELHLHPNAQYELVGIVAAATKRGVRIWMETHSSAILRALQTKVASGHIAGSDLALNWFARDPATGVTKIVEAEVNDLGQYGEWPVDFDDVSLSIEKKYLDAVGKKVFGGGN